ncbi:bacteriocin, partial [Streptococcus pneumoniae]
MNTKMLSQLEVMDTEMLACVEGGDIDWGRK